MSTFASAEWAKALENALSKSSELATASTTWVHGPILLSVRADEERDFAATAIYLDIHDGKIVSVVSAATDSAELAPFELSGTIDRWKSIASGDLSIVDAVFESKLNVRGDLTTLSNHREMFDLVAKSMGTLETAWPEAPVKA